MEKTYWALAFFFVTTHSQAQQWKNLAISDPVVVHQVEQTSDPNTVFLPMPFAKHTWNFNVRVVLQDKHVLTVSLVYTRYRTVQSFDQVELNKARMSRLRTFAPELFDSSETEWILVEQTGADSRETGREYFHGFMIQTRPKPSEALAASEMEDLEDFRKHLINGKEPEPTSKKSESDLSPDSPSTLDHKPVSFFIEESQIRTLDSPAQFRGGNEGLTSFLIDNLTYPEDDLKAGIEGTVLISFVVDSDGSAGGVRTLNSVSDKIDKEAMRVMNLSPKWKPAEEDCKPVSSNYTIPIQFDADGDGKTKSPKATASTRSLNYVPFGKDEVVSEALERNSWNKMAIVCDLTGSMSAYTKQLLRWFSTNIDNDRIHSFTFFNDGDGMPDRKKIIGEVGGIYHSQSSSIDSIIGLVKTVMRNGDGDDTPENNLEATIEAALNCPDCELVMIADNYATPRDLRLVEEIKKPLRIILCGASPHLNTAYLQLAYNTGGSIHTLYDDIEDLQGLPNGSLVEFGMFQYRLNNRRFVKEPLR